MTERDWAEAERLRAMAGKALDRKEYQEAAELFEKAQKTELATGAQAFDILGPEPVWKTCACGRSSARVPCIDCTVAAEEADERRDRYRAGLRTIPKEFEWAHINSPELAGRVDSKRRPLQDVIASVLASHRCIVAGAAGSGKTSLLTACLRERLHLGARFVSASELATARIQHAAGDGEALIVEQAMMAKLLLIDDLGEEQHTTTNAVRDVIRFRHNRGLATWVTTGLPSRVIATKYGDGIKRRLFEGAYCEWLGPLPERKPK